MRRFDWFLKVLGRTMISRSRSLFPEWQRVRAFNRARCRSVFAVIALVKACPPDCGPCGTYAQIPVKEAANIRELSLATRVRNRRALDRPLDTASKTTNESEMCKPLECTFAGTRNLHWTAARRARSSRALMCSVASFHGDPNTRRQCHQPGSIEDRGKNPGCS